jgi:hypothetical protein
MGASPEHRRPACNLAGSQADEIGRGLALATEQPGQCHPPRQCAFEDAPTSAIRRVYQYVGPRKSRTCSSGRHCTTGIITTDSDRLTLDLPMPGLAGLRELSRISHEPLEQHERRADRPNLFVCPDLHNLSKFHRCSATCGHVAVAATTPAASARQPQASASGQVRLASLRLAPKHRQRRAKRHGISPALDLLR